MSWHRDQLDELDAGIVPNGAMPALFGLGRCAWYGCEYCDPEEARFAAWERRRFRAAARAEISAEARLEDDPVRLEEPGR